MDQRSELVFLSFTRHESCNHMYFSHRYSCPSLCLAIRHILRYFKTGSINVRSVAGSKRFCIVIGSTVTITASVGDEYTARTWPPRVVPSGPPTTMCVWTTGFP